MAHFYRRVAESQSRRVAEFAEGTQRLDGNCSGIARGHAIRALNWCGSGGSQERTNQAKIVLMPVFTLLRSEMLVVVVAFSAAILYEHAGKTWLRRGIGRVE